MKKKQKRAKIIIIIMYKIKETKRSTFQVNYKLTSLAATVIMQTLTEQGAAAQAQPAPYEH